MIGRLCYLAIFVASSEKCVREKRSCFLSTSPPHPATSDCAKCCSSLTYSSLLSIGGDIDCPAPGIYMHILWDPAKELAGSSYLYVGQSGNIQERIRRHNDPWNRARHPSLHYHLWDSKPGMNSAFVILGNTENLPQLQLNLLESWCSLIFQTLPRTDLRTYLPKGTVLLGCHLNVAHPLWQSFTSCKQDHYERKEKFRELVLTCDPMMADYYRSLARAFHELKDSSNPVLRAYWLAAHHRSQVGSSAAKMAKTLSKLLGGVEKVVNANTNSQQNITVVSYIIGGTRNRPSSTA